MSKIQQAQQNHAQIAVKKNKPAQQQHQPVNLAQMFQSPENLRPEDVLVAQQTVGNQVVQRALDKEDRRKGLTDEQGNLRQDIASKIQQKRGSGVPLPENIQKEASKKLGRKFKDVRIHTDETADALSRAISARAFTIGKDIFFKNGVFAPGTSAGRETIIHELTHVVQQGGKSSASGALKLGAPDTAHEKEADQMGKKHASVHTAAIPGVQRAPEEEEIQMQQGEEDELMAQRETGIVQAQGEEDELMAQRETGIVQAQGEEDELMAQRETGIVQAQGEEDELMMQGDDDLDDDFDGPVDEPSDSDINVMMQEDEEELMMQPAEEDELQMQPDVQATIQRAGEQDEKRKKKKKKKDKASKGKGKKPVVPPLDLSKLKPKAPEPPKGLPPVPKSVKATVKSKSKFASLEEATSAEASEKRQEKISLMEHDRDYQAKVRFKEAEKAGKISFLSASVKNKTDQEAAAKDPKQVSKQKWLATLKDPKASKEDIKKAKERLRAFHKDVGKKDFKAAKKERISALEEAAKSGDDEAYEKWQSEREKTKGEKAKGFFKSVGSGLLSAGKWTGEKALSFAKSSLTEGVNHFLGSKEDDKDNDTPKVNITDNIAGSGRNGSGGGGATEMIAELYQENKKLKAQIAELEKAKV